MRIEKILTHSAATTAESAAQSSLLRLIDPGRLYLLS